MTDKEKNALESFIKSATWQIVKGLFLERADELTKTINKSKDMAEIGLEYVAKDEASKLIKKTVTELEQYNKLKNNDKSYI